MLDEYQATADPAITLRSLHQQPPAAAAVDGSGCVLDVHMYREIMADGDYWLIV